MRLLPALQRLLILGPAAAVAPAALLSTRRPSPCNRMKYFNSPVPRPRCAQPPTHLPPSPGERYRRACQAHPAPSPGSRGRYNSRPLAPHTPPSHRQYPCEPGQQSPASLNSRAVTCRMGGAGACRGLLCCFMVFIQPPHQQSLSANATARLWGPLHPRKSPPYLRCILLSQWQLLNFKWLDCL